MINIRFWVESEKHNRLIKAYVAKKNAEKEYREAWIADCEEQGFDWKSYERYTEGPKREYPDLLKNIYEDRFPSKMNSYRDNKGIFDELMKSRRIT